MSTMKDDVGDASGRRTNVSGIGDLRGIGIAAVYQVTANTVGGIAGNPINGEVNWAPGAIFQNPLTANKANMLFVNVGSKTSALWRQLIGAVAGLPQLADETITIGSNTAAITLTAAQTFLAEFTDIVITGAATGTFALNLDSTAHLTASLPSLQINDAIRTRILNNSSVTLTLTAGDGSTTVQGNATVGAAAWRDFDFLFNTVTGNGSITITNAGAGTY